MLSHMETQDKRGNECSYLSIYLYIIYLAMYIYICLPIHLYLSMYLYPYLCFYVSEVYDENISDEFSSLKTRKVKL